MIKFLTLTIGVLFAITSGTSTYAYTGHIAYVSDRDGQNEIYLMEMDGSNQTRLTDSSYDDITPVFSPDGQKIAFFSNRSGSYKIYTMNWNGTDIQEISNSECATGSWGAGRGIAWSPNSQKLLFKPTNNSLATINLDGSEKTIIWDGAINGHSYIQGVEWGPTLNDIYVNAQNPGWGYDQHIFRKSDGGWTQITDDVEPLHSHGPQVSSQISRIVFDRQEGWDPPTNIYTMGLNGEDMVKLTFDTGSTTLSYAADWFANGNGIVFCSSSTGSVGPFQIWIMDSTGVNLQMLPGEGSNFAPSWSPVEESATVLLVIPNGGEVLTAGSSYSVIWSSAGSISNILIEYSNDNGSNWTTIDTVPNTGSYNWLVPMVNSNQCLVRISDSSNPSTSDTSDSIFTIDVVTIYVDNDAPNDPEQNNSDISDPLENGSDEHPYDSIQEAIDVSFHGDTIIVLPGTYTGNGNRDIDFNGKAVTMRSADPNDPNVVAATIIDCNGTEIEPHRGFHFHSGEDTNSIVDGFNITNGYGPYVSAGVYPAYKGGAVYCYVSSPTIRNCKITGNSAEYGGGVHCWTNSSPTITKCTFSNNTASIDGGGMDCDEWCHAVITNCTFIENSVGRGGGGIEVDAFSDPILKDCTFIGNSAGVYGGGIVNDDASNAALMNCTIINNTADEGGGGLANYGSNLTLTNCIFIGNSTLLLGGGMLNIHLSDNTATLSNCTFVGNSATDGSAIATHYWQTGREGYIEITNSILWNDGNEICNTDGSTITIIYSDVQGGWPDGEGNIDADPCFVDPMSDDYHLQSGSPCINTGDPNYVAGPNETDLDGNPRVVGGRVDMGAYEFQEVLLPDLEITSEDITFVPVPGEPCEPVTITATIWNIGVATTEDVNVVFYDFDELIGSLIIPKILTGDTNTISIQHEWPKAGFHLITVTVDPNNEISESDKTNNEAAKLYQVGEEPRPGVSIEILCSTPTGFPQGSAASINGQAIYRIQMSGQPDFEYPVKGGSVSAQVIDCNGVQQNLSGSFTDKDGKFGVSFAVPCEVNDVFDVNITVTDGTFSESMRKTFNVTMCRDFSVGNITFSDDNPDVNETITISATVYASTNNTNAEPNVPVTFYVYLPIGDKYQIGQTQYTGEMLPGASKIVSVDTNFPANGDYYIQVVLEPNFSDDISWNNQAWRSIHIGPPIPPPFFTVTAEPRYNVRKGDVVKITIDAREPLPSNELVSITVRDSANRDIPFVPSDPCHPTPTQWLYETNSLPQDIATGTATITVTGIDSHEVNQTGYGYFEVSEIPVKFDIRIYSEDINFSKNNPDINETITIEALINASSDNTRTEPNIPVTFYAHHAIGETYKIGRTQNTGEIQPGGNWSVSSTWRNAAEGGYVIEVILGPGFSDDNSGNNQATLALVVGDFPFVAYFEDVSRKRVGRTIFEYTCNVTLYNNSDIAIEDVQLELVSGPNNMTIIDSNVTYNSIGQWGSATSGDTCVFNVDRTEEIEECDVVWRAVYKAAGTGEVLQQVFTNCSPLPPIILPGDFTSNGIIDLEDLAILTDQWLQAPGIPFVDIVPDGIVNFQDFAVLAENWLQ